MRCYRVTCIPRKYMLTRPGVWTTTCSALHHRHASRTASLPRPHALHMCVSPNGQRKIEAESGRTGLRICLLRALCGNKPHHLQDGGLCLSDGGELPSNVLSDQCLVKCGGVRAPCSGMVWYAAVWPTRISRAEDGGETTRGWLQCTA